MKLATVLRLMHFWGPYFGAGVRVSQFDPKLTWVEVEMRKHWWNSNYHGTHFGGSLFSMTDPFLSLILIHHLGERYAVWDKSAAIRFKKPGIGTVRARFEITSAQIEEIRQTLEHKQKVEPQFHVKVLDTAGDVVAEVDKILSIKVRLPH